MIRWRVVPLLMAGLLVSFSCAAETARGVVFEDRNGNGSRDPGERGLPGVAVSNGLDVVLSDGEGKYELDVEDGTVLFVTKPSGYRVPLGPDLLPRHYYIHDPDGTPATLELRYPGVEPTGALPETVDFPLRTAAEPHRFDVIWFADPQTRTAAEIDYLRDDVVAELVGVQAAFGITAGDIMYNDLSLYPRYNQVMAQIGIPWYNVPGNHDLNFLAESHKDGRETFKRYFGPPYHSFDYGNAHFVLLDDVHYLGANLGTDKKQPRSAGRYEGRIEGDQLTWLANDLRLVPEDRLVVVAMHIPLRCAIDPVGPNRNVVQREGLFEVLKDRKHLFLVSGHMHTAEHHYFGKRDGWEGESPLHQHVIATASGSWWSGPLDERGIPVSWQRDGSPNGYYVMTVDGTRVTMRLKAASESADLQMRIVLDPASSQESGNGMRDDRTGRLRGTVLDEDQVRETEVVVNLFDGGPHSTVEYRIGSDLPVRMARDERPAPFFEDYFVRFKESMVSWVEVEPSSHIWTARLPAGIGPGVHTLTVRAVDEYGREQVAHKLFEVVGQ